MVSAEYQDDMVRQLLRLPSHIDRGNLWHFQRDRSVGHGVMTVNKAVGNMDTKRTFKPCQLPFEFRIPDYITGTGQTRGNSGVFLASTGSGDAGYELHVLDNYNNKT